MDRTLFPDYVNKWVDLIEETSESDPQRMLEYCTELEAYATDIQSDALLGYSLFFRGVNTYSNGDLTSSSDYLTASLTHLIETDEWEYTARTYTALGNIADSQGDISLAIDYYFKGLTLCQEQDFGRGEYSIRSNLSSIFISLGAYADAVDMLKKCEQLTENGLSVHFSAKNVLWANLCECYINLGDMDSAATYLKRLKETYAKDFTSMDHLMVCMLETKFYHATGDLTACKAAISALNSIELTSVLVLNAFSELCHQAELLLTLDAMDDFLSLTEQIKNIAKGPSLEAKILELYMKYHKKLGDRAAYADLAVRYYEIISQLEAERNKITSHNILTRMRLEEEAARRKEIESDNLALKQQSERDALTGLSNRYKLNELAEQSFFHAYSNGTLLTLEILDIDFFKEYNDNYGHQAGDSCLIQVANAIHALEETPGIHTARYGGDEFVIIYENYSREDVERFALKLQETVRSLNIEHKYSKAANHVTISQGLFHKIPSGGNKLWDFLYGADMALYGVKKRSKNNYYIGTTFNEVRAYCHPEQQKTTP